MPSSSVQIIKLSERVYQFRSMTSMFIPCAFTSFINSVSIYCATDRFCVFATSLTASLNAGSVRRSIVAVRTRFCRFCNCICRLTQKMSCLIPASGPTLSSHYRAHASHFTCPCTNFANTALRTTRNGTGHGRHCPDGEPQTRYDRGQS